ncbi:hypothetical protein HK405_009761 [Cladochytrium tenue]|nr:hypothetical protein HK405_009761 [Cladochytrium tenue]
MLWPGNLATVALLQSLHPGAPRAAGNADDDDNDSEVVDGSVEDDGAEGGGRRRRSRGGGSAAAAAGFPGCVGGGCRALAQRWRRWWSRRWTAGGYFGVTAAAAAAYEAVFAGLVAPGLASVSPLCWVAPGLPNDARQAPSREAKLLRGLGSAQPNAGLGLLSLSFDWAIIGTWAPLTTPVWALLNQFLGVYLLLYVLTPILWVSNAFGRDFELGTRLHDGPNGTGEFPLGFVVSTAALFDGGGGRVQARGLVDSALRLREDVYARVAPLLISTAFAVEYAAAFAAFAAAIVHVSIWHGRSIWRRARAAAVASGAVGRWRGRLQAPSHAQNAAAAVPPETEQEEDRVVVIAAAVETPASSREEILEDVRQGRACSEGGAPAAEEGKDKLLTVEEQKQEDDDDDDEDEDEEEEEAKAE